MQHNASEYEGSVQLCEINMFSHHVDPGKQLCPALEAPSRLISQLYCTAGAEGETCGMSDRGCHLLRFSLLSKVTPAYIYSIFEIEYFAPVYLFSIFETALFTPAYFHSTLRA